MSWGSRSITLASGAIFGLAACSGTGPNQTAQVSLSVMGAPLAAATGVAGSESVTLDGHTLVLDQVTLVLRKIELKRVESTACPEDAAPSTSDGSGDRGEDDCEEIAVGPVLADLPLGGGPERVVTVPVDTGTYRGVEFKIHRLEQGGADQAVLDAHPEFLNISIRATGTFDGQPFTFTTDISAEQEARLEPPLAVVDGVDANLTLKVDLATWFMANGALIDPAQALRDQPFEGVVRSNIERSFHLFEDHDFDGHEDDH